MEISDIRNRMQLVRTELDRYSDRLSNSLEELARNDDLCKLFFKSFHTSLRTFCCFGILHVIMLRTLDVPTFPKLTYGIVVGFLCLCIGPVFTFSRVYSSLKFWEFRSRYIKSVLKRSFNELSQFCDHNPLYVGIQHLSTEERSDLESLRSRLRDFGSQLELLSHETPATRRLVYTAAGRFVVCCGLVFLAYLIQIETRILTED